MMYRWGRVFNNKRQIFTTTRTEVVRKILIANDGIATIMLASGRNDGTKATLATMNQQFERGPLDEKRSRRYSSKD
jgi:hypothetical protein